MERPVAARCLKKGTIIAVVMATLCFSGLVWSQTEETRDLSSLRDDYCTKVWNGDTLILGGAGRCRLIGVYAPRREHYGWWKSTQATIKYAYNKRVKIEICPTTPKDRDGFLRVMIYFREGGKWYNLNTKLLRSGLASYLSTTNCHIDTSSWVDFVKTAESKPCGLWRGPTKIEEVHQEKEPFAPPAVVEPLPEGQRGRTYVEPNPKNMDIKYVGVISTHKFHRPHCAANTKESDQVYFTSRFQAIKSNYVPCLICKP